MCRIGDVFPDDDLKELSKQRLDALQEYGRLVVLTNPAIQNLIKNSIKKNPKIRRKLQGLLRPELRRLKNL